MLCNLRSCSLFGASFSWCLTPLFHDDSPRPTSVLPLRLGLAIYFSFNNGQKLLPHSALTTGAGVTKVSLGSHRGHVYFGERIIIVVLDLLFACVFYVPDLASLHSGPHAFQLLASRASSSQSLPAFVGKETSYHPPMTLQNPHSSLNNTSV